MFSTCYSALITSVAFWTVVQASAIPLLNEHHRYAPRNNHLEWQNCSLDDYPGRECARFEVPLDWHDEVVGKVSLAVIRYPAIKSPKLGTLFMNPGGPGSGGVQAIQGAFGWDPRGVGESGPSIACFGTLDDAVAFWNGSFVRVGLEARGNFTSQTDLDEFYEQVDEVDDRLTRFGKQCVTYSPNAFQYIGTAAVVRDMVAMHDVLEGSDKPINFWGISYGTIIGIYFVNMFPDRVGHVVIDGVVNPKYWANRPAHEHMEVAFQSSDEAFEGFTAACAKAGPSRCAIAEQNSTQASLSKWTRDLINAAYDNRRTTGPSAQLSSAFIRSTIFMALYQPRGWSTLALQLKEASTLLRNPTSANTTQIKRWLPTSVDSNHKSRSDVSTPNKAPSFAYQAITCADAQDAGNTTTKDVFDLLVKVTRNVSHMFGPIGTAQISGTYCHRWPVRAVERFTGPWNKKLSNPILVIGNEADPITPYVSAKHVADSLGSSAVLIEQDDYGHGSTAMYSNCTVSALQRYFLHDKLPRKDKFCGTNQELFPETEITKSTLREL
ncbi:hydrolase, putative [Rhizoctonia solani AG-3 Rhs1AP]|uniref:Hydrolase, putative n=2 Tax=Rhizoctonia solani AG-3 TaxID=1086053 RepID=X8JDL6_9AGAM|nr:hydrolase, putative [Rhizoctonia solani AG-3 Rhs1AP]KEP46464.1 putative hydrolase [Rhizoctonia solani 123E]